MGLAKRVEGRSLSHVESRGAPRGSWAATNRPCERIHLEGAREGEREGQDASSCSSAQWRSVAVGGDWCWSVWVWTQFHRAHASRGRRLEVCECGLESWTFSLGNSHFWAGHRRVNCNFLPLSDGRGHRRGGGETCPAPETRSSELLCCQC